MGRKADHQIIAEIRAEMSQFKKEMKASRVEFKKTTKAIKKGAKETEKALQKSFKFTELKSKINLITGGINQINRALQGINDTARKQDMAVAFARMTGRMGIDSKKLLGNMKDLSAGIVTDAGLIEKANYAKLLGINLQKIPQLLKIARASARATGQSFDFMFQSLILGIGRKSRLILDNLGILVSEATIYKDFARQFSRTTESLTEAERAMIFMNATLKAGQKTIEDVGVEGKSSAENIASLSTSFINLFETLRGKTVKPVEEFIEPYVIFSNIVNDLIKSHDALGETIRRSALDSVKHVNIRKKEADILRARAFMEEEINSLNFKFRKKLLGLSEKQQKFQKAFIDLGGPLNNQEKTRLRILESILSVTQMTTDEIDKKGLFRAAGAPKPPEIDFRIRTRKLRAVLEEQDKIEGEFAQNKLQASISFQRLVDKNWLKTKGYLTLENKLQDMSDKKEKQRSETRKLSAEFMEKFTTARGQSLLKIGFTHQEIRELMKSENDEADDLVEKTKVLADLEKSRLTEKLKFDAATAKAEAKLLKVDFSIKRPEIGPVSVPFEGKFKTELIDKEESKRLGITVEQFKFMRTEKEQHLSINEQISNVNKEILGDVLQANTIEQNRSDVLENTIQKYEGYRNIARDINGQLSGQLTSMWSMGMRAQDILKSLGNWGAQLIANKALTAGLNLITDQIFFSAKARATAKAQNLALAGSQVIAEGAILTIMNDQLRTQLAINAAKAAATGGPIGFVFSLLTGGGGGDADVSSLAKRKSNTVSSGDARSLQSKSSSGDKIININVSDRNQSRKTEEILEREGFLRTGSKRG